MRTARRLVQRRPAGGGFILLLAVSVWLGGQNFLSAQQIVDNPATPIAKNAGRVVALKEVLRIIDEGAGYYFKYPFNLRIGPDSAIFVQEQEQLLRFDASGRFVRNYFKKGQGPGEMVYCGDFLPADKMLIVLSSSPPKIIWFDEKGTAEKEVTYISKTRGGLKFVGRTDDAFILSGSDSPFLNLPKSPSIGDWIYHLFVLKEGAEAVEDRATFPVQAYIIPSSGGGGGIIPVNSLIAVQAGEASVALTHTPEYLLKIFNLSIGQVALQFRRDYERVKPDQDAPKKGGVIIDGKHYTSAPVKYTADITNLVTVGDRLWVVTSTIDPAKGVLIDVFDLKGRYLDNFFLKFPEGSGLKTLAPSRSAVAGGYLYALILTEEETYAVVKYRIEDTAAGGPVK
jgi:hypothetical protein